MKNREIKRQYIVLMKKLDELEEVMFGYKLEDKDYKDIELDDSNATIDYMLGVYNGIEIAQSMVEDRKIKFKDKL